MRLLIIEDHAPLREGLCQYLREAGYLVDSQATGDEGLWATEGGEYDVVLLDRMLPGIDGTTILRRLRAMEIDPLRRIVKRGGKQIELTALEYRLLEYLCYRTGEVVTRADIWERVFEDGMGGSSNAVDVYIGYLRKKLNAGELPDLIHTRRGQGYVLESPPT